ncbi:apolipoprotein D-like [Physella acuta]|uniref:apolipoprotein D-like n=1 Tax=Physella acuta TaxID=109671 RepID=UPI0027DDAEC0|nr:apolipoprotein D-like [Physella acuta]
MIVACLVVWGALLTSSGSVPVVMSTSRCYDVPVKADFDVQKFMGLWKVHELFPTVYLEGVSCPTMTFTQKSDNYDIIDVIITGIVDVIFFGRSIWRSKVEYDGVATIINSTLPAQWSVTYGGQPEYDANNVNFYVVSTDYHTYAIVYSCTQPSPILDIKIETAYILVRDIQNPPTILGSLKYSLRSWGVNTTNFIPANNKHC